MSPKIDADSIADQRSLRQRQLTDAALSLALEGGAESITVSAVAAKAGLARSSFYEYFSSSADLIADLVMEELESYRLRLSKAVAESKSSDEYIANWVEESLKYVVDGRHMLVKSLNSITLPDFRKAEIAQGHRALISTIIEPLAKLGIRDIHAALTYLQNTLDTASTRIEAGNDAEREIQYAKRYAFAGLRALSDLP